MKSTYEIVKTDRDTDILKRTDADGSIWWIPVDESNSDYRVYLESLNDDTETE